MTHTFAPSGDRAQWRIIYDEVRRMKQGQVITYERLSELIDRDVRTSHRVTVDRAIKELENHDHRTLVCVRGEGFRVAAPTEHEGLADRHTRRSQRQLKKAVEKVRSADRSQLTREQAARLDSLEARYAEQAGMVARLSKRDEERAAELRQLRRETTGDIAHLGDEVARLHAALKRHGIPVDEDESSQERRLAG